MTAGFTVDLLVGILFAVALLFYYRKLSLRSFKKFFSKTLVFAALIYVGFALYGAFFGIIGLNWLFIELIGVLIYLVFGYLGVKKSAWFLAIGWAGHVIWDVGLHWGDKVDFVPTFYPTACIGFDIIFAVFIVYRFFIANRD